MASTNAINFNTALEAFGDFSEEQLSVIARKVALDLLGLLSQGSPVLTGRFRANWQVAVAEVNDLEVPWNEGPAAAAAHAISAGVQNLAAYPKKGLPVIFIFNNLIYGIFLNEGLSKQAPDGVVEPAIDEIKAQFI